jgi:signal transduction histidine kinase
MNTSSQEVLGRAGARLAHELKNSLTGIVGALQVLQDRLRPSPDVEEILQRVDAEVRRIEESVKELSDFAEPKAPVLKPIDVQKVVEKVLAEAPLKPSTQIVRHYQEDMPQVRVDEKLIGQALHRVVLNAVEAMPEGGTVTVSTTWAEDRVTISIRDTGHGVPAQELSRIFDPFVTSKTRGLGLGLAISRALVDVHGGHLSVVSPVEGGTEFIIVLPHEGAVSAGKPAARGRKVKRRD